MIRKWSGGSAVMHAAVAGDSTSYGRTKELNASMCCWESAGMMIDRTRGVLETTALEIGAR